MRGYIKVVAFRRSVRGYYTIEKGTTTIQRSSPFFYGLYMSTFWQHFSYPMYPYDLASS